MVQLMLFSRLLLLGWLILQLFGMMLLLSLVTLNELIVENAWQILRAATSGATGNRTGKNLPEKRTMKEIAGYFAPGDTLAHFRPT
jgi:hypothetical protein